MDVLLILLGGLILATGYFLGRWRFGQDSKEYFRGISRQAGINQDYEMQAIMRILLKSWDKWCKISFWR